MADGEAFGETKPEPKQEGGVIEIIVKDQNGTEVHFKVKPHTRLEKVGGVRRPEPFPAAQAWHHAACSAGRMMHPPDPLLSQVIKAYCEKKGIEPSAVRFVYDGTRINPNSTPLDVSGRQAASLARSMQANDCARGMHCLLGKG